MEEKRLINKKLRARRQNNLTQLAVCCNHLGAFYMNQGQYEEALENFKEELALYDDRNDAIEIGRTHRMIGDVCLQMNELEDADRHITLFLDISKKLKSKIDEERAHTTQGRLRLAQAERSTDNKLKLLADAKRSFLIALDMCKELPNVSNSELKDMEARLYINIGLAEDFSNDHDAVLRNFQKALEIGRRHDLKDVCYLSHFNMALAHKTDLKRAYNCACLAADVADKFENTSAQLAEALLLKATISIKMDKYENAKKILCKAYRLKTKIQHVSKKIEKKLKIVIVILQTEGLLKQLENSGELSEKRKANEKLGDALCTLKNFEQALVYYGRALDNAERCGDNLSPLYVSLYTTYRDLKQYKNAIECMQKELDLNKDTPIEAFKTLLEMVEVQRESIDSCGRLCETKFWDIDELLDRAQAKAGALNDLKYTKEVLLRKIELREFYKKQTLVDIIKDEARMMDIDIDSKDGDTMSQGVEYDSEPQNVPEIGDEINLDELSSDSSDNSDDEKTTDDSTANTSKRRSNRSTYKVKKNEKGETPLHRYCIDGNFEQVERLIKLGHPINVHDNFGWLPLHEACNHGHVEIVALLLKHKASINDTKNMDKISPLHDACACGQLSVVDVLLDAGADVALLNKYGETPFDGLKKIWRKSQNDVTETDRIMYDTICNRFKELNKSDLQIDDDSVDQYDTVVSSQHSPQEGPSNMHSIRDRYRDVMYDDESSGESSIDYEFSKTAYPLTPQSSSNYNNDQLAAVDEYQNVINKMRSGKKSVNVSPKKPIVPVKRPAFLDVNEVGENWLDNDLPPAGKRQRIRSPTIEINQNSPRSPLYSVSTDRQRTEIPQQSIEIDSDNDGDDYLDAYGIMMGSSSSRSTSNRKPRRNSTSRNRSTFKDQSSTLLDSGFVRTNRLVSSENIVSSSSEQEAARHSSPQKPVVSSKISVAKVKIEDQVLCVPIVNETVDSLTVGWLADEAARRYYNLKGIRPILRLCSGSDKAVFEHSDPVAILLAEQSIDSVVLEWDLPALSQRYTEACMQLKQDIDPNIRKLLPLVQATHKLEITNQLLNPVTCKPILKAIHQQHLLTIIDLSNNFIEDDGVKLVALSLPALAQLKELNLSGNMISLVGIRHLNNIFQQHPNALAELGRLSLNYNMLGNESVPSLAQLCQSLPKLQSLALRSIDITQLSADEMNLFKLTSFDISFNTFMTAELGKILQKLNYSILQKLDISFCTRQNTDDSIGDLISVAMYTGTCQHLKELHFAGLHLKDPDVYSIVDAIYKYRKNTLDRIDFSDNPDLSPITLQLFLERVTVEYLHLENCRVLRNLSAFDSSIHPFEIDRIYPKNLFFTSTADEIESLKRVCLRLYKNRCNFISMKRLIHVHISAPL